MNIMNRVKALMHAKGISRADLVKLSGLKKTTVYRLFEDGIDDSKIRIETLAPIAKALDTNVDFLLGKEDAEIPESLTEATKILYEKLSPTREQLEKVTNIIKKLPKLTNKQIQMIASLVESYDVGQSLDNDEK